MKLPYFPGCTLRNKARGFDASAREAMAILGVELVELMHWNCCGATFPLVVDNLLDLTATARVLAEARAEGPALSSEGVQLAVACATCYNVLKRTNLVMRDNQEKREKINFFIEKDYAGDLQIRHLLEVLRDQVGFEAIGQAVKKPLKGLKVASYYGCMLLRPSDEIQLDDVENPRVMEDLFRTLGAEAIVFPHRGECCGSYLAVKSADVAMEFSYRVLSSASRAGTEVLVSSCPLCQFNLDRRQGQMAQVYGGFRPLPVLYFTQLMGLAFGMGPDGYELDKHYVDPRPLLRDKGLIR